jgi:nitroreductase
MGRVLDTRQSNATPGAGTSVRRFDLNASDSVRSAWHLMTSLPGIGLPVISTVTDTGLSHALRLVREALYLPGPSGKRRVPSAGAIFPYTSLVFIPRQVSPGAAGLYRLDAVGKRVTGVPLSDRDQDRLATMLANDGHADRVHVILALRPWLSMRKYGARGYVYAHIDAGHAAANISGLVAEDLEAILRLRLPRSGLDEFLSTVLPFLEIHSVVSLKTPTDSSAVPEQIYTWPPTERASASTDFESVCWESIRRVFPYGSTPDAQRSDAPVVSLKSPATDLTSIKSRWSELSSRRRSSRQFTDAPLNGAALVETVEALTTTIHTDLGAPDLPSCEASVRVTLIVRDDGWLQPAYHSALEKVVRVVVSPPDVSGPELVGACMGQEHVAQARAFLLLHIAHDELIKENAPYVLRESLFRAACAAQLIYLGATSAGLGLSTIGGFDNGLWRLLATLPDEEELLCLLALGVEHGGPNRVKADRGSPAVAHGEA